jgi:DNA-binding transcriptional ArsR family regulator
LRADRRRVGVVFDARSAELRRALGASSWFVLEELLLQSEVRASERVAEASVRSLARALGVTKDTVARAIGRLRAAGIVAADQARSTDGRFETTTYAIVPPIGITFIDIDESRERHPVRTRSAPRDLQLALTLEA